MSAPVPPPSTLTPLTACPIYAPILGAMGAAFAISLTCFGAAYGTAKSGAGIAAIGVMHPELVMRSVLPIIMAGIIGLYGLIVDVMMLNSFDRMHYPLFTGALHLGAGLCVGLSGLAAGIAIGVIGDAGVRGVAQQPRLFMGMVLILIFAEVLGLYGMIVALLMNGKATANVSCSS